MSWLSAVLSLLSAGCAARAACLWLQASLIDPLDDPLLAPSSLLSGAAESMSCFAASHLFLTRALQRVRLRLRGRLDEPKAVEFPNPFWEPTETSWALATLAAVRKSGSLNAKAAGWAAGAALLSLAAVLASL
jgi:hypothetical protein